GEVRTVLARADDVGAGARVRVEAEIAGPVRGRSRAGRGPDAAHVAPARPGATPRAGRSSEATTRRPTWPPRIVRASAERPESEIRTWASSRRAVLLSPRTPHFVWSATTTTRPAAAISAWFVSASSRLGV